MSRIGRVGNGCACAAANAADNKTINAAPRAVANVMRAAD
jgi:hypothetical protein